MEFLPFDPDSLGHCIEDPYYLIYNQSEHIDVGLIRTARNINEEMPYFYAKQIIKKMVLKGIQLKHSRALVCGITFKENCADTRNSKVPTLVSELEEFGIEVEVYDPVAEPENASKFDKMITVPEIQAYDRIVFAVAHQKFKDLGFPTFEGYAKHNAIWIDLKMFSFS